jgi:hypothetical protein
MQEVGQAPRADHELGDDVGGGVGVPTLVELVEVGLDREIAVGE